MDENENEEQIKIPYRIACQYYPEITEVRKTTNTTINTSTIKGNIPIDEDDRNLDVPCKITCFKGIRWHEIEVFISEKKVLRYARECPEWRQRFEIQRLGEKLKDTGIDKDQTFENFKIKFNFSNKNYDYTEYVNAIRNFYESEYKKLYICGDIGLGKTHLLKALLIDFTKKRIDYSYMTEKSILNHIDMKANYKLHHNAFEVEQKWRFKDVFCIDDLGRKKDKAKIVNEFLTDLIDEYPGKKYVFTSNILPQNMKEYFGGIFGSRIAQGLQIVHLKGINYRLIKQ